MGIIGVVAALTIPTLVNNYQKKQTISKLKKAYSVLSQVLLKSVVDNGSVTGFLKSGETVTADETKKFFNTYWLPYFKVAKIAEDNTTFYSSQSPYTSLNNSTYRSADIYTGYRAGRILFLTSDNIMYYITVTLLDNQYDEDGNVTSSVLRYNTRQLIYVDINGISGPNVMGKDVFMFVADFDKNIIRPNCSECTQAVIARNCSNSGVGDYCAAKIIRDGWNISDDYPW